VFVVRLALRRAGAAPAKRSHESDEQRRIAERRQRTPDIGDREFATKMMHCLSWTLANFRCSGSGDIAAISDELAPLIPLEKFCLTRIWQLSRMKSSLHTSAVSLGTVPTPRSRAMRRMPVSSSRAGDVGVADLGYNVNECGC
jgi:hypothetical protein